MHSTNHEEAERQLLLHGVKPTATRLLVYNALAKQTDAQSLASLEDALQTVDKSTIFRSLSLFRQQHLVHEIDDGSGSLKYEPCHHQHQEDEADEDADSDLHAHFFCTHCQHTYCLKQIEAPVVDLPEGFCVASINYVLKGICPNCKSKQGRTDT